MRYILRSPANGADGFTKNNKRQTPIQLAENNKCGEWVRLLLPVSAINAKYENGNILLHHVHEYGHWFGKSHNNAGELLQNLITMGANVNVENQEGQTPLHILVSEKCIECVKLLLPVSDMNAQDTNGNTFLHYVHGRAASARAYDGMLQISDEYIKKNAMQQCRECPSLLLPLSDINAQDKDGNKCSNCMHRRTRQYAGHA